MRDNYDILVYGPLADDFETEGLCGPLYAYEAHVIEQAGDDYRLEFQHPYDPEGCWRYLAVGMILRAWVLMRTPPAIDELGGHVTSVEIWRVKETATKAQRYLHSKAGSKKDKKLKLLPKGAEVVVTVRPETGRVRCSTKWGAGWMDPAALEYEISTDVPDTGDGMEAVLPGAQLRAQQFEIYQVEMQLEGITVYARHVTYQLMKNLTTYVNTGSVTLPQALQGLLENCEDEHEFAAYSDLLDARTGVSWVRVNPIEAMLDPETGCVGKWPCEVLRDNYDLFFLEKVGVDRGVAIELGKNLAGITISNDMSNVATWLLPVGTDADGSPLLLPEVYVKSPLEDQYAQAHIYAFQAEDAQVGTDISKSVALYNMRQQCAALLAAGCDRPALTISVDVVQVDEAEARGENVSEQREIIALLEPLLVYDAVHVHFRGYGYDEVVVERDWDPVHLRMRSCVLGVAAGSMGSVQVATWQLPGGIDGQKLAPGTVGPAQLGEESVSFRHVQAGSISTDKLAAGAITADKMAAGVVEAMSIEALRATLQSLTAGDIATNSLTAAFGHLFQLVANNIRAGTVTADRLDAVMQSVITLTAGTADFDAATVTHLIGSVLDVTRVFGGYARIENLYVTDANLVNATMDRLTVRGADERYYDITVGSDGMIAASERQVTPAEQADGVTVDGRAVVQAIDLDIVGEDGIDGRYLKDAETGLRTLYAQALSTGRLTAVSAMIGSARIPSLEAAALQALGDTLDLSANESVNVLIGEVEDSLRLGTRNYLRNSRTLTWEGVYGFDETAPLVVAVCDLAIANRALAG